MTENSLQSSAALIHPLFDIKIDHLVPVTGGLSDLKEDGYRFLFANDGMWLEVRSPWLYCCLPLAVKTGAGLPYGIVRQKVDFLFGDLPYAFLEEFEQKVILNPGIPIAAWITWSAGGGFKYYSLDDLCPTCPGSRVPILGVGEHLVFVLQNDMLACSSLTYVHSMLNQIVIFKGAYCLSESNVGISAMELLIGTIKYPMSTIIEMLIAQEFA